ncbi:hypothetical protein GCM10023188_06530 [Pontibacter saemangeumensis]|uniref:Uncharacterized protein n=1 Tax=Pontibacter saemangeumensis TaxID=1084525 RepID=A0ABP8LAW6_9BACT
MNLEVVKSLGSDKLIDYRLEDFTHSSNIYDVIFDAVGKITSSKRKRSMTKSGIYLNRLSSSSNFKLKVEELILLKRTLRGRKVKIINRQRLSFDSKAGAHR